ncbi:hypothetical protein NPIL_358581 [Nephila pilipes]|uniref:Uncharacterized protein n=1 Tax=Nephila pilipes TaxID=299642 RepID=A0A8X6PM55_NEPPI|nr:hypothetical protein NPIL_139901 [Nephila pilipes]GFU07515.1 hypothetical protein NPIL_358581 [Nephila pilipes]
MPRRDRPFVIVERNSPVSYSVANTDSRQLPVGVYHTSALTPFQGNVIPPVKALCRRERPARIIKPNSPTPTKVQIHKGSQNTSSSDPYSGRLRGRLQPMVLRTKPKNQQMALSAITDGVISYKYFFPTSS